MIFKGGLITFVLAWGCFFSFAQLEQLEFKQPTSKPEMIYLPSGRGLDLLSFGYQNALAHSLWFNAINYFGKHYRGDQKYEWLDHYCNLVTDLAPRSKDYYHFCGTILSWEANNIEASISILSKAINAFPDDWIFYYLRGFTKAFFSGDNEGAKADFIDSAQRPGANPIVIRLASKKIASTQGHEDAVEFLKNAIELAQDPSTKSILENRLEELIHKKGLADNQVRWAKESKQK